LLVQRKETKRKHAPDGALLLRSAALGPALTRRDIPSRESAAGILPAALRAPAQSLAVLGCAIPGLEQQNYPAEYTSLLGAEPFFDERIYILHILKLLI